MRRFKQAAFCTLSILFFAACNKNDDSISVATQASNIEAFIDAQRKLGRECWLVDEVYHVLLEEGTNEQVRLGDSIFFDYTAATFSMASELGIAWVFDTNIKTVAESHRLNTNRTFEQQKAVAGGQGYIRGLENGLLQLRKGQTQLLIFTSDLGYGGDKISIVPPNSPLVFRVKLLDIKKNS